MKIKIIEREDIKEFDVSSTRSVDTGFCASLLNLELDILFSETVFGYCPCLGSVWFRGSNFGEIRAIATKLSGFGGMCEREPGRGRV
jgi:hypothetical protein